jgi:putative ABC transport system permease protein
MNLVVRTTVDPRGLVEEIKREVRAIDPTQPVSNIKTMEQLVNRSIATDRFSMWLFTLLGTLALALASTGLFGLLSYFVSQRSHELGVRIALGAQRTDIFKLILGQGAILVLIGLTIGIAASLGSARLLSSLLFEVSANDPLTFVTAAAVLVIVGFLASYLPAWRATRVDPLVVLKSE